MFQLRGLGAGPLPGYCTMNPYDPACSSLTTSSSLTAAVKNFITSGIRPKAKHPTKAPSTSGSGLFTCLLNPRDPSCAGKPATSGSSNTPVKPPGLPGVPTAGTQINPATGLPYAPGTINPATGLPYGVAAPVPWYTQWWGLALIGGAGYLAYTMLK